MKRAAGFTDVHHEGWRLLLQLRYPRFRHDVTDLVQTHHDAE